MNSNVLRLAKKRMSKRFTVNQAETLIEAQSFKFTHHPAWRKTCVGSSVFILSCHLEIRLYSVLFVLVLKICLCYMIVNFLLKLIAKSNRFLQAFFPKIQFVLCDMDKVLVVGLLLRLRCVLDCVCK